MQKVRSRHWFYVALCGGLLAGCAPDQGDSQDGKLGEVASAITAIGDPLPGTDAAGFAEAKAAFTTVETLADGLGPIFNERACGNCHTQGAIGGAGTQIERRFGTTFFFFGVEFFDPLANDGNGPFPARGGSLRQLQTVGSFTGLNGRTLADNAPETMLSLVTGTAVPSGLKPSVAKDQRGTAFPYVVPA